MYLDVTSLRAFYAGPLGRMTTRLIRARLRGLWPDTRMLDVLGLGYAVPFLQPFRDEARRVIALMPAAQGVAHWPPDAANAVALADDHDFPLPDMSVDRVVLAHGLENSEQVRQLLREIWRVLAPGGRVVFIVPNRLGAWARSERTPFGHGHAYSVSQLTRLLTDCLFAPVGWEQCLFWPPSDRRIWIKLLEKIENFGRKWWPGFAGVLIVEAEKQIYAVGGNYGRAGVRLPQTQAQPARILPSSPPDCSGADRHGRIVLQ